MKTDNEYLLLCSWCKKPLLKNNGSPFLSKDHEHLQGKILHPHCYQEKCEKESEKDTSNLII